MSLSSKHLYHFGDFCLDTKEKILMCGTEPIELTPKGFELLTFFVENPGRLLKKEEIMEKIWGDSFVEEGNLTFNIRQLRIILNDDAQNPTFIKTIRQHGYRFIAAVTEVDNQESAKDGEIEKTKQFIEPAETSLLQQISSPNYAFIGITILLILGVVGALFLFGNLRNEKSDAPVLQNPFSIQKLSESGKVINAILSPDGKSVVYSNNSAGTKQSLWIRNLEEGSNIEIIPPMEVSYIGFGFSPDGKFLYFARSSSQSIRPMELYRLPVSGGIPQNIIEISEGWFGISPDGAKISFIRCAFTNEEWCSLWVADSDGKNERKLLSRPAPLRIGANNFSPDGKIIAFTAGQSKNAANEFGVYTFDLATGKEQEFSKERFFNIKNLSWLPDQKGILMTARKNTERHFRICLVSTANGSVTPLSKDSETYSIISMDKDATQIISTQIKSDFRIRLISTENPQISRLMTDASSLRFAPDGKIIFASKLSGSSEIWSINQDGTGQRQLTNNAADDSLPLVSPDNKTIFFVSNQSGVAQIWRMNPDGSNQTQVTKNEGGFPIFVSPNGEWLYYIQNISFKLFRISLKTGENQIVIDKSKNYWGISPDGSEVAYSETKDEERFLNITNLATGQTTKTFNLAEKKLLLLDILWLPDNKNILYITFNSENSSQVLWKQAINEQSPQQILVLNDEEFFENYGLTVSPDGKNYAVVQGKWLHDVVLLKGLK